MNWHWLPSALWTAAGLICFQLMLSTQHKSLWMRSIGNDDGYRNYGLCAVAFAVAMTMCFLLAVKSWA